MLGLRDRYGEWALVTGASSGIGRAFAHALADEGVSSVLVANDASELEAAAREVRARGVEARPCYVDLAGDDFVDAVQEATADLRVSLLVNNAAFGSVGEFLSRPFDWYDRMIRVNTRAYVALTHAYLPALREQRAAGLVFVSSINAVAPIGRSAVYTATKAFDLYLGCALWWELKETAVDVLVVLPGPTRTGFQAVAGTQVASWAMDPAEVADGALAALGTQMTFVPGEQNRALVAQAEELSLDERVEVASRLLGEALIGDTP